MKHVIYFILLFCSFPIVLVAQEEVSLKNVLCKVLDSTRLDSAFFNHRKYKNQELYVIRENSFVQEEFKNEKFKNYPWIKLDSNKQIVFLEQLDMWDRMIYNYIDLLDFETSNDTISIKFNLLWFRPVSERVISQIEIKIVSKEQLNIIEEIITPIGIDRKPDIWEEIIKDNPQNGK